jgi:hypothetical protein
MGWPTLIAVVLWSQVIILTPLRHPVGKAFCVDHMLNATGLTWVSVPTIGPDWEELTMMASNWTRGFTYADINVHTLNMLRL